MKNNIINIFKKFINKFNKLEDTDNNTNNNNTDNNTNTNNNQAIHSIKLSKGFDNELQKYFIQSEIESLTDIYNRYYYETLEETLIQNMPNDIFDDLCHKVNNEQLRRIKENKRNSNAH